MKRIVIGLNDKTPFLLPDEPGFLLIDDGPVCDAFLEHFPKAKELDLKKDGLNPLPMNDGDAREFADIVFGDDGIGTLTVRNGKRALTGLLMKAKRLDKLGLGDPEALAAVDDLLLSPVLKKVLCKKKSNWIFSGAPIIARINRAELGEHNARILVSILISQFPGQIIIPDFGFYARPVHASLIRQDRLIAGVYELSELKEAKLHGKTLLMEQIGNGCTYDDAVELAKYKRLRPDPTREDNDYNRFIDAVMAK